MYPVTALVDRLFRNMCTSMCKKVLPVIESTFMGSITLVVALTWLVWVTDAPTTSPMTFKGTMEVTVVFLVLAFFRDHMQELSVEGSACKHWTVNLLVMLNLMGVFIFWGLSAHYLYVLFNHG